MPRFKSSVCGSKRLKSFLLVGDRTVEEHALPRLPDDAARERFEVPQCFQQATDFVPLLGAVALRSLTALERRDEPCCPVTQAFHAGNQALVVHREVARLASLAGCPARHQVGQALDATKMDALLAHGARIDLASLVDQSPERAVPVPQERGIRRPVDVGLHRGRVETQLLAGDLSTFDSSLGQHGVQLLPGLGPDRVAQLAQRGVIHHRSVVDPREAPQVVAIVDTNDDLAQ